MGSVSSASSTCGEPSVRRLARIDRLVTMTASAARGGNVTAAAEFNAWSDPDAAQAVLNSTLPTLWSARTSASPRC